MAQNKGTIVRYRAIDRCLRSKHGKYGIEELRAACADALYDAFSNECRSKICISQKFCVTLQAESVQRQYQTLKTNTKIWQR